jgi:hypothetical protein
MRDLKTNNNTTMKKTPQEVADDILNSLRVPNAPERILLEVYLEKWKESIRREVIDELQNL